MRESAASAKRVWFMFGATPAQSETSVRARGQAGVHPIEAKWEKRRKATARNYAVRGTLCRISQGWGDSDAGMEGTPYDRWCRL